MHPQMTFFISIGEGVVFSLGGLGGILCSEYTDD